MINNGVTGSSNFVGGNQEIKKDTIWNIAARNNKKGKRVTHRINGERASRSEFEVFKGSK